MPLSNACFISFRHGQQELTQSFVSQLHTGLCGEIEAQLGREVGVFLDEDRLRGGDLFNEAIAEQLWRSSCLVMVYTPTYFDIRHPYCAREYKAMVKLEEARLRLLGNGPDRTHGLIIPIIFRGMNTLPPEIRDVRHCYDFADFLLTERKLHKHSKYAGTLKTMAEYISERHRAISAVVNDDYVGFRLPPIEEILTWLQGVIPGPVPLPGRLND